MDTLAGSRACFALLLALLAACTFDGQLATEYKCAADGTCPSGLRCVAQVCTSDDDSDSGGPGEIDGSPGEVDGGPVDSGPIDATPGGADAAVARFTDDFGDNVIAGWSPWTHSGCTVAETGGVLQLAYVPGAVYCGADTTAEFDLRTGSVTVEVVAAPALLNFEAYLVLFSGNDQIQMIRDGTNLTMRLRLNGSVAGSATIVDPGERFWRVHQEGSTTIWETSADRVSWHQRHSTSVAVDASAMGVELAAGGYGAGITSSVQVRFDGVTVE